MYNGEIISYSISERPSAKNIMDALEQAIKVTAKAPYRRTFHSDQGWAYQMKAYSKRLKEERTANGVANTVNIPNPSLILFFIVIFNLLYCFSFHTLS